MCETAVGVCDEDDEEVEEEDFWVSALVVRSLVKEDEAALALAVAVAAAEADGSAHDEPGEV